MLTCHPLPNPHMAYMTCAGPYSLESPAASTATILMLFGVPTPTDPAVRSVPVSVCEISAVQFLDSFTLAENVPSSLLVIYVFGLSMLLT